MSIRFPSFAVVRAAFLRLFGVRPRPERDSPAVSPQSGAPADPPAPPPVLPWPEYAPWSAIRGIGEEYSWAWRTDREQHSRNLRTAGINLMSVGLFSCAEDPTFIQVRDRTFWIRNIEDALARVGETVRANRKMRIWTKVAIGHDCGLQFPVPTIEQVGRVVDFFVALGTEGVILQPCVEGDNAKAYPWRIWTEIVRARWPGAWADNSGGGRPVEDIGASVRVWHPQGITDMPLAFRGIMETDTPSNDEWQESGPAINPETGLPMYYTISRIRLDALRELKQQAAALGHGLIYWQPHYLAANFDWLGARELGA